MVEHCVNISLGRGKRFSGATQVIHCGSGACNQRKARQQQHRDGRGFDQMQARSYDSSELQKRRMPILDTATMPTRLDPRTAPHSIHIETGTLPGTAPFQRGGKNQQFADEAG